MYGMKNGNSFFRVDGIKSLGLLKIYYKWVLDNGNDHLNVLQFSIDQNIILANTYNYKNLWYWLIWYSMYIISLAVKELRTKKNLNNLPQSRHCQCECSWNTVCVMYRCHCVFLQQSGPLPFTRFKIIFKTLQSNLVFYLSRFRKQVEF